MLAAPPDAITSNAVYLYVLLVVVILGIVVSFIAKQVPVVGKTIDGWVARRRRAAKLDRNADVDLLKSQVQNLAEQVAAMQGRERTAQAAADEHRHVLTTHAGWDWQAQQVAVQAGVPLAPAPPLYPPTPPTTP